MGKQSSIKKTKKIINIWQSRTITRSGNLVAEDIEKLSKCIPSNVVSLLLRTFYKHAIEGGSSFNRDRFLLDAVCVSSYRKGWIQRQLDLICDVLGDSDRDSIDHGLYQALVFAAEKEIVQKIDNFLMNEF